MKTIYWDVSDMREKDGPIAIFSSKVNVVSAGTTFRVMSPRTREQTPQYGEVEERYGIFFFFSDRDVLEPPFFCGASPDALCPGRAGRVVWTVEPRRGGSLLYHTRGGALSGV